MLTIEEIRERLKDRNLRAVARNAGLHYNALYRLKHKHHLPSYGTLSRLSEYLEEGSQPHD